jgi:hypothetical protein
LRHEEYGISGHKIFSPETFLYTIEIKGTLPDPALIFILAYYGKLCHATQAQKDQISPLSVREGTEEINLEE